MASSVGGTVSPSALAVRKLMTNSNLAGCQGRTTVRVRFAPKADNLHTVPAGPLCAISGLMRRRDKERYSMTLSARASSVGRCPSGSSFVLDCANDRREYGAASASGDHL